MARTGGLVTFEEFHALWDSDADDALRQQRERLREDGAAEEILDRGKIMERGWPEWPSA